MMESGDRNEHKSINSNHFTGAHRVPSMTTATALPSDPALTTLKREVNEAIHCVLMDKLVASLIL
jgi:hypothetical protein